LQEFKHIHNILAMPKQNSKGLQIPKNKALPPEATTEKEIVAEDGPKTLQKAAEDGRLSIRAADLAPRIIEGLAKKFGPDKVVEKLGECLNATKTVTLNRRPMEVTDFKIRLDALKLLLQYQVGNPVSRSEVVTHNVDTMQTLESKMQKSPALRRAVGAMLDRSKVEEGEIVDIPAQQDLSDAEAAQAEEDLQAISEQPETPIEAEVRVKNAGPEITTRGPLPIEEKLSR